MKKNRKTSPIWIEVDEWWFKGCFIQRIPFTGLFSNYEIFKDTDDQEHIARCITFTEAKAACVANEVVDYKYGPEAFA